MAKLSQPHVRQQRPRCGAPFEALTVTTAGYEALALFKMIGRQGETVDSIRDLILVDEDCLKGLLAFLATEPKEFRWVMQSLRFRELVMEKFDRLAGR